MQQGRSRRREWGDVRGENGGHKIVIRIQTAIRRQQVQSKGRDASSHARVLGRSGRRGWRGLCVTLLGLCIDGDRETAQSGRLRAAC
jgi:hypothetical protein